MKRVCVVALLALAGCEIGAPPPLVADYNGASVKIQTRDLFGESRADAPAVVAEASRICGSAGRRAEYASTLRSSQTYTATHLFLCLGR